MLFTRDVTGDEDYMVSDTYTEETPLAIYDLIDYLQKKGFFPDIPKGSLWSISYNGVEFGRYESFRRSYSGCSPDRICAADNGNVHFKYFPSGEERARYLYRHYCGNKRDMYFDGRMEEYRSYQIPAQTEQEWRDSLIRENIYRHFDESENISEGVSLLKNILSRPGVYVGRNRLDLIELFFQGWCMHQKTLWSISYDLKQWLFLNESVSGSCSLNGWSVFYETYGVTDIAVDRFREFLNTNEPASVLDYGAWDTATEHIGAICYAVLHPEGPKTELKPYLDFSRNEEITEEEFYLEIIRQVKRVIGRACERIKVYINSGRPVLQVRFLFWDDCGWRDGVSLNTASDYYEKMVALHGYINLINKKRDTVITTIDWNAGALLSEIEEYQIPGFQFCYDVPPEEEHTMSHRYSQWEKLSSGYPDIPLSAIIRSAE